MERMVTGEEICRLWDDLSDFGAHDCDKAFRHCMERLCEWLEADDAFWIGAVRLMVAAEADDAMSGWRVGGILNPPFRDKGLVRQAIRDLPKDPGMDSCAIAARAGEFRVHSLFSGGLVDLDAFRETPHYDINYRQQGVSDRLWAVFPVNDNVESYFCIDKYGEGRRFSREEMDLVAYVLRGIKWFHRQLLISHGLGISDKGLAESERRVLKELLTGASEKVIAERLELKPSTVHQYAVAIFRKFGARSRAELMSLWLSALPEETE